MTKRSEGLRSTFITASDGRVRRRPRVKGVTIPAAPRRRAGSGSAPSLCLACSEPIDRDEVGLAIVNNVTYRHGCGRVLFTAIDHRAEAEHTAEVEGYGPR